MGNYKRIIRLPEVIAIFNSKFARKASQLTIAIALSQILGLAGLAVAALFIPVAEIGVYTVFLAYFNMFDRVVTLGYAKSLPNIKEDELAAAQIGIAMVVVAMSLLGICFFSLLYPEFVFPMAIGTLATGAMRVQRMMMVRLKNYSEMAFLRIIPNIGIFIAILFGATYGYSDSGYLINCHVLSLLVTATIGLLIVRREQVFDSQAVTTNSVLRFLKREYRYPLLVAPSELLNSAAISLPTILIQSWFPAGDILAAQYALTRRIGFAPMGMIGQGVSRVFHGVLSDKIRSGSSGAPGIYRSLRNKLLIVSVLLLGCFYVIGPHLVLKFFGEDWELAAIFLRILSPAFCLTLLAAPLAVVFYSCETHGVLLQSQLFLFLTSVLSIALGAVASSISVGVCIMSVLFSCRMCWLLVQSNNVMTTEFANYDSQGKSEGRYASAVAA